MVDCFSRIKISANSQLWFVISICKIVPNVNCILVRHPLELENLHFFGCRKCYNNKYKLLSQHNHLNVELTVYFEFSLCNAPILLGK